MKRKDIVLAIFGHNKVTNRPYEFLYEYGYQNTSKKHIVYRPGECNMQDASCFDTKELRIATEKDILTKIWG